MAMFAGLPESPLLTLSLQVPHAWFVESVQSVYDLDNIHLAGVGSCLLSNEFYDVTYHAFLYVLCVVCLCPYVWHLYVCLSVYVSICACVHVCVRVCV